MDGHVPLVRGVGTCALHMNREGSQSMQIVHDVRSYANEHAPILLSESSDETMMQRLSADAVWACTLSCLCRCLPLYIEHVPKLTDLRRNAMMEPWNTLSS